MLEEPTVVLDLPRGKFMKTIIDRMGKIAKQVSVFAEQSGRMIFSADHSDAAIKTYFAGLYSRFDTLDRVSGA